MHPPYWRISKVQIQEHLLPGEPRRRTEDVVRLVSIPATAVKLAAVEVETQDAVKLRRVLESVLITRAVDDQVFVAFEPMRVGKEHPAYDVGRNRPLGWCLCVFCLPARVARGKACKKLASLRRKDQKVSGLLRFKRFKSTFSRCCQAIPVRPKLSGAVVGELPL